jgi:diguanylate cyclase (GGDEF)-like protein/PAS domain S-box-containing protein
MNNRLNSNSDNSKFPSSTLTDRTGRMILIVDDWADNLRVLSTALTENGFQTRCARSGAIALTALQTTSPDLILLDIKMPDMDGFEVCQRLQASELTSNIPVIFLSALDDVFDKEKAFGVGCVDFITKPFHVEEVLLRIKYQIAVKDAKDEIAKLNQELEFRVEQRTIQLAKINQDLEIEIVERIKAEKLLQINEARLDSILSSLKDAVWSVDPTTSQFVYLNDTAEKIYGYPIASFFEDSQFWLKIIHPEDLDRVEKAYLSLFNLGSLREEYRILRPDGETRWVNNCAHFVYDANGYLIRMDGLVSDITDQKRAQEQLIHDALHDALTNLPNRSLFMDRIEQTLKHSKRQTQYLFAIMFIDLDRFKMINDSLGHAIGDRFLQIISQLLESCLRSQDTVARFGGDEFTVLIDNIQSVDEAIVIADRILNQFLQPIDLANQTIFPSASIGIAISNQDYERGADLLRDADIAMYRAKSLGKGRYALFSREMYETNLKTIQIDHDLRYALERNEFELHYQPIISLSSGKLSAFEALIRWQHPTRGFIPPQEFIPIAEETGLIIAIGDWVLNQACKQMRAWQIALPQASELKISVNLASQQVREDNILEKLDQVLAETGIEGSSLRLEITESSLMDHGDQTISKLEQLRARNIQLSIDDFGQGYSSLSYLHRFPVNTLKIDRTFVEQMSLGGQNLEIIRTITILAHALNMDVIAEGVETHQQVAILKQLGCEYAQGYFFSRPVTAIAAKEMII